MGSFGFHCAECDLPMLSEGPDRHDACFKCEDCFGDGDDLGGCKSINYLMSPDGEVYEEKNYEGYGVYGGKDAYALLAQTNVEAVREWFTPDMPNMHDWEPTGDNDEDRMLGIDLAMASRKKTHEEIRMMILDGITITENNIYHYAKDLIKNPLRIVCQTCYAGESYKSAITRYDQMDDYQSSRDHINQSWSSAHDSDVGWVCDGCYGW